MQTLSFISHLYMLGLGINWTDWIEVVSDKWQRSFGVLEFWMRIVSPPLQNIWQISCRFYQHYTPLHHLF